MEGAHGGLGRFLSELKRRNVYRVAITYGVVAFVVWQVADLLFSALRFPAWTTDFVVVLTLLGFPVALVLAWAFEMTPEGVRRTPPAEGERAGGTGAGEGAAPGGSDLAIRALVGLGLLAAAGAGVWYLTGGDGEAEPRAEERSIAVLPFSNLSGTDESLPFVNGLHDDLLTRLSNISELKVISRTSVLPYRETSLSLPQIADSLGVTWIVEGGVQQVGDQVQVNAQLIQAENDTHRWAESYRRRLTPENLFAIQGELTKKIARSQEAQLTEQEESRVERTPTKDLGAYRLYVRGRNLLDERTGESMRDAVRHFERAREQDSSFALAWSGLADAVGLLREYGYGVPEGAPDQEETARRALELAPDLAAAHASLSHYLMAHNRGGPALRHLQRAVELQPSYAQAHITGSGGCCRRWGGWRGRWSTPPWRWT